MEAMHSPVLGYLRFPTFGTKQLYFVAEDNLWEVALEGGRAQRLTESRSELQTPRLSPCGRWLALVAAEEGDRAASPARGYGNNEGMISHSYCGCGDACCKDR